MLPEQTPSPTPVWSAAYQTLRPLARGGMGSVDIAVLRKPGFRRLFAIKRLRPELLEDERAKSMLIEEGRIAGLLRHPNIVPVVDVGEDEQGPYLVMDLVPGVPLGDLVRRARATKKKLDVQLVLRLLRDAARGLHAAHELKDTSGRALSLVHRDVSPQNILVGFDGIARVTDFGIAKVLDRERETTHGLLKGKTGYMAPEQLRFETVDRRADLFSLGVVLYECLAGERLYRGKDLPETARMILHAPPPDIGEIRSDVSPDIVELLFELLAKDRDARPETAKEVESRLDAAIHALTPEDGPFDIERFMRTELNDKFEETTQWARLLDAPLSPTPTSSSGVSAAPVKSVVSEVRDARRTSVVGWLALGAVVLSGVVLSRCPSRDIVLPATPSSNVSEAVVQMRNEAPPDPRTEPPTPQPEATPAGAPAPTLDTPPQADDPDTLAPRPETRPARGRGRRQPERSSDGPETPPRRPVVDQEFWTEKP